MNTFNELFERTIQHYADTIGNTEKIDIDGIGEVVCKVDTGNNAFNVLHGVDVKQHGNDIEFTTVNGKRIKKPILDSATIHIGSGNKEDRPITTFNVTMGGKHYPDVKFTISDRTENSEPVLLGKDFLSQLGKLIDINKDFTLGTKV